MCGRPGLDAGRDVVVLDDLSTGFRAAVPEGVPLRQGDVADTALVSRVLKEDRIEAVMHFAGSISVPESVSDPAKYYRNNTCASLALAKTCIEAGVNKFIFSSTASVYGLARQPSSRWWTIRTGTRILSRATSWRGAPQKVKLPTS